MTLLFVVLCIIHCQYYEPHYSQEFLIENHDAGAGEIDFFITINTKDLIEDGMKMDPYCRDFRLYLNESVEVQTIKEFWFEDKCGSEETVIWTKLEITEGDNARLIVTYGSDYFIEEDEVEYGKYLAANWGIDHNNTNYWDGEFFLLQENECSEFEEYGLSSFPETNGLILYPRPEWWTDDDPLFIFKNETLYDGNQDSQHHTHAKIVPSSRTSCTDFGDDMWVNVSAGTDADVAVTHLHAASMIVETDYANVPADTLLPSHRTYQMCKGKYNTRTQRMLALTDGLQPIGEDTPLNHENVETNEPYGRLYGIRLHESETSESECTVHGHENEWTDHPLPFDVYSVIEYSEKFCIEPNPFFEPAATGVTVNAGDYHEVAPWGAYPTVDTGHAHTFDFDLMDADMCGAFIDIGRGVKLYRSNSTNSSDNYHERILHMASKLPPFGYTETNFGLWVWGDNRAVFPLVTMPEALDMSVDNTTGSTRGYNCQSGWIQPGIYLGHDHKLNIFNVNTSHGSPVLAEKATGPSSIMALRFEHIHKPEDDEKHYFHTEALNDYESGDLFNASRWATGYPGFAPHVYTRVQNRFVVRNLGEVELISGYERNSTIPDDDDDDDTPTIIDDGFDFLWVFIAGGGTAAVILPILLCAVLVTCCCLLCLGGVVCIFLCCGCIFGTAGIFGLSLSLKKKLEGMKEEKIKEGAQRQMRIAQEKSKFRQEKKKVGEELKKAEEEEKEIAKTVTQLEEEKSKVAATMRDARPSSRMKVIDFEEVQQEEKLGKGYLGFKIYRAIWPDETVLFRVFSEKTFKTTRFNIFGNFEAELGEYSTLEHPNVLRYIAYSKLPNVGVVTEYCENATLPIYLRKHGLSFEEKVSIVSQVVEGMFYLHQRGVIHRDLQAGNIFLTEELSPKVDFGFNRTFNKKYERSQYAAPELINPQSIPDDDDELPNHEKFDVKCDVFSFGILMYEIANAREGSERNFDPYDLGDDKKKKIACKVAEDPEYRPDFENQGRGGGDDIPNWYINLAQMCWAHKAQERPSFERIKNILKNVSSMGDDEDESSSSGTETEDSD